MPRAAPIALFLILYGNVEGLITGGPLAAPDWLAPIPGIMLLVSLAAMMRWGHIPASRLGVSRATATRGALWGLALGALCAGLALLVIASARALGAPVSYAPLALRSTPFIAFQALVGIPLETALPEESAFRGLLLGELMAVTARARAVLLSALAFTLWHGTVLWQIARSTNLGSGALPVLAIAGAAIGVFIGGCLFALLRLRTGSLLAAIGAHWAFNSLLLVGLDQSAR